MDLSVSSSGQAGRTVDYLLSERRDVMAAKRFFSNAMKKYDTPRVITLDAASHRGITELQSAGTLAHRVGIQSSKYLNNVVEQDHRHIKQRVRAMLGFKQFDSATITISGIELAIMAPLTIAKSLMCFAVVCTVGAL